MGAGTEPNTINLKVSEGLNRDAGKGLARMDPEDMKKLDVSVGDIISIRGKRMTVAKVMPAYPDDRGKEIIQIDGLTRRNADTGIGEKVKLSPVSAQPAKLIYLTQASGKTRFSQQRDTKYVGKLLNDLPVVSGDVVRATLFGSRFQEFIVSKTSPDDIVLIHPDTRINIEGQREGGQNKAGIAYEDIGGLDKAIQRVREMIELPLRHPQLFQKLGIEPPKGVLLHGPPGCGKTLLARAVANETDAAFFSISGPEVIHKFYGESERQLREIFEQAKQKAPSIIFLDEIDSIAPKREKVVGDVEKRVVAQLLALLDGLKDRGQIVVVGATNLPNMIDPALRRPGRFDREIVIGIPDAPARLQILEIHTRGMPLFDDIDLDKMAEITHGYTGADLEALSREAAMTALRTIIPKIDFDIDSIPYEILNDLNVTMDNFMDALNEIEPSGIREVFTEVPNVHWEDVGGLEEIKQELQEAVEWPMKYADAFKYANISPTKGVLIHGAPGTGKTLLAKAVATESQANFISIKGPELISKWVGESEKGIREVFQKARQSSPCVLFLDELDAIAPPRSGASDSHVSERVISQLLTEMDGIEELRGVVVLAATNRRDLIDEALLRPGRLDLVMEMPKPDEKTRLEIFKVHTREKPLADDINYDELAKMTDDRVGADIEFVCRRAAMIAIREFIQKSKDEQEKDYTQIKINMEHFQAAMKAIER
ncbi:CDC48 family AAA ATPase [Candidatus Poribacteria bacterium]|nr:CDC48 family AAA ATPase [Candidatus Poribacteria bacterium]